MKSREPGTGDREPRAGASRDEWRRGRELSLSRSFALVIAAVALGVACTDFEAPDPLIAPDVLVASPSFARDVQPILTATCATTSCHSAVTHQLDLALDADHAYDELVQQRSLFFPGLFLVAPGRADSSWMVNLISADSLQRFDHPRMPLGRAPLSERQIQTIVNWINQGAKRN
jgi:hypothetical protein